MSARTYTMTEELRAKWTAEGRGRGKGENYTGWIKTHEIHSIGNKYRKKERINGHLCHWLSTAEYNLAQVFQLDPTITALMDQFPLPVEETRKIAADLGIEHPRDRKTGVDITMTTDIVIEADRAGRSILLPVNVKLDEDLGSMNNIEHAEIERRWWQTKGFGLKFCNDSPLCIPAQLLMNAREVENHAWLHQDIQPHEGFLDDLSKHLFRMLSLDRSSNTLAELCKRLDEHTGVEKGQSLKLAYHLISRRILFADFGGAPIHLQRPADIAALNLHLMSTRKEA